jgi:hypothetical protein
MTTVGGIALRVSVSRASSATDCNYLEPFDITAGAGKNEYDEGDDQSVGAWSTVTKGNDATSPGPAKASEAPVNSTASVVTSTTSLMSTLSPGDSADSAIAEEALLTHMRSDPLYAEELMRQFMASSPSSDTTPPTPKNAPLFSPHHLAFGESMLRQLSSLAPTQDTGRHGTACLYASVRGRGTSAYFHATVISP